MKVASGWTAIYSTQCGGDGLRTTLPSARVRARVALPIFSRSMHAVTELSVASPEPSHQIWSAAASGPRLPSLSLVRDRIGSGRFLGVGSGKDRP